MDEMIFFDPAKDNVTSFFDEEFANFPPLVMSHFLNNFNEIMYYKEEGNLIRPKIIFTNNIESLIKSLPKAHMITIFEDKDATNYNMRMKSLLAICQNDWCVFVNIKDKITYGLAMSFASIKDKSFLRTLEESTTLKDKQPKIFCIVARPLNFYALQLHSISGRNLIVNFSLDKSKYSPIASEIRAFVDATFAKLRTTQRKLQDMKNMYYNIIFNALNDIHGTICVVVDKDYVDNGFFEDGIWLKEPISYSKLFAQSKSYNEVKLRAYSELFKQMLNYDGITVLDNKGRILAYNVFVETNSKKLGYIVGGARKRAAYQIINTKRKGIEGVFFLSHEGEAFYKPISARAEQIKVKGTDTKKLEVNKDEVRKEFKENVEKIASKIEEKVEMTAIQLAFNVLDNAISTDIVETEIK